MSIEATAHRIAAKHGYAIRKSRAALSVDNEGGFMLVEAATNRIEAGERFDMSAEDVINFFKENER